jgi:Peptidase family S41
MIVATIGLLAAPAIFQWALKKRFEPVLPPAHYPHASNQLEAERQDLDYLEQLMHLDRSFSPAARARFEQERTALIERHAPLTEPQFQLAIDHLVTLANNGHTSTLASQRAARFGRAQVRFAWFGDGLYIVRAKSDFKNLLGARVLMIDGRDPAAATAAARPYVTGIDRYAKWYSLPLLETPELLHAIWSDADPEVLRLRVLTPDGKQTDARITSDVPRENHNKLVPIRDIAPAQIPDDTNGWRTLLPDNNELPLSLREPNRSLFSSELANDTLYIRINQVLPDSYGSLKQQLAELTQRSAGRDWRHIILDLRFNTGGNYLETTAFRTINRFPSSLLN